MGCWNATCSLTNLSILADERIVACVVRQSRSLDKIRMYPCYPNTLYTPITPWIRGSYDDYGRIIQDDNDLGYSYLEDLFKCGKLVNDSEINSEDDLISNIERGNCLYVKDKQQLKTYLIFCLEKIFDDFTNIYKNKLDYSEKTMWENYVEFFEQEQKLNKLDFMNGVSTFILDWEYEGCGFVEVKDNKYIDIIKELGFSKHVFGILRKTFTPLSGCGSQSVNFDLINKMGDIVKSYTTDVQERIDNW